MCRGNPWLGQPTEAPVAPPWGSHKHHDGVHLIGRPVVTRALPTHTGLAASPPLMARAMSWKCWRQSHEVATRAASERSARGTQHQRARTSDTQGLTTWPRRCRPPRPWPPPSGAPRPGPPPPTMRRRGVLHRAANPGGAIAPKAPAGYGEVDRPKGQCLELWRNLSRTGAVSVVMPCSAPAPRPGRATMYRPQARCFWPSQGCPADVVSGDDGAMAAARREDHALT